MKQKKQINGLNRLVTVFVGLLFLIYPIYFRNFYFDIVQCRFYLFTIATGVLSIVAAGLFFYLYHKKEIVWEPLSNLDWLVLLLWWANLVSVIGSDYTQNAIIGTSGRRAGLITLTCYVFLYFLITRFYVHKDWIYIALFVSSALVSIVAIFQFIDMDFLGFYENIHEKYKETYFTTMGHINVVASFFGMLLPMGTVVYMRLKKWWQAIGMAVVLILSMCGLYVIGCESGVLIFAFMILTALLVTPAISTLYRMCLVLWISLGLWKALLLQNERSLKPRKLETIQKLVDMSLVFRVVWIGLLILMLGLLIWNRLGVRRTKEAPGKKTKAYYITIAVLAGICILGGIGVIVYFSTIGRNIPLGKFENMLRVDETFGSYRGYIWNLVVEEYMDLPILKKMIGVGCDSLKPFLSATHYEEMVATTGFTYDNAHNEYLQYLITTGLFGLVVYIATLWAGIKGGIGKIREQQSEVVLVAVFGVIGYLIQALVNINQCVTTPIFLVLFAIMTVKQNQDK